MPDSSASTTAASVPFATMGADSLKGGPSDDNILGLAGADTLRGLDGDDTLNGGPGNDSIDGGTGRDQAQFPGRMADYALSFNTSTWVLTLQDLRSSSLADFAGTDTVTAVEEFVFAGDASNPAATKTLVELVTAAGKNYGVDLNGSADPSLVFGAWTGPNSYFQNTSDPAGYTRSGVLNPWSAEIGLAGGIQAIRLSYLASEQSLLEGLSLQWMLGPGNWSQGQYQLPLGAGAQVVSYQDGSVTLTARTVSRTEGGQTWNDLVLSAPSAVSNESMRHVLSNVRIGYASGTQPEREDASLDFKVAISANGQSWVGAQAGQADTMQTHFDNSGPKAAVASYKGALLSIAFKDVSDRATSMSGDAEHLAWRGQPAKEAYDVRINGQSVVVRSVSHEESGVVLWLTQDLPSAGAVVTVAYTDPSGDTVRNVLQDSEGNDVPSFRLTATPALAFDATASVAAGATRGYALMMSNGDNGYVGEDGFMHGDTLGKVVYADVQTAKLELTGRTWGVNPNYDATAAAGSLESYLYLTEKVLITVAQPVDSPLVLGAATMALIDMVKFTGGLFLQSWTEYVLVSNDATALIEQARAIDLANTELSAAVPMWFIGTGKLLGGKSLTITGGAGNDELRGLGEQVMLSGDAGDDTYQVPITFTGMQTTIDDSAGAADVLKLSFGRDVYYRPEVERVGDDLIMRAIDRLTDTVTIRKVYAANGMPGAGMIETIASYRDGSDAPLVVRVSASPDGQASDDLLVGGSGNDSLRGLEGDDHLYGAGGDDLLDGGAGSDNLRGGSGNNTLRGSDGSDEYYWNPAVSSTNLIIDAARAGAYDRLNLEGPTFRWDASYMGQDLLISSNRAGQLVSAVTVQDFRASSTVRSLQGFDFLPGSTGTLGNNWMVGETGADTLLGGDGDDLLMGSGGNDRLEGGKGHDKLFGGSGADTLAGGAGDDIYVVNEAGDAVIELASDNTASQQTFSIGNNNDVVVATINYSLSAGAAVEDMIASGMSLTGDLSDEAIHLTGNEFDQGMTGNDAANDLRGMGGDDAMIGLAGNDTLDGGEGNDFFLSGLGNDVISGGAGDDGVVAFAGQASGYNIFGLPGLITFTGGFDTAVGGSGTDLVFVGGLAQDFVLTRSSQTDYLLSSRLDVSETLSFSGFEKVSFGHLIFNGDQIQETPWLVDLASLPIGPAPNITGTSGHDSLRGSSANELISGLAGNDSLDGGGGSDTLDGGEGVDSYWIDLAQGSGLGNTMIVDSSGTDRLVLSASSPTDPNLDFRIFRANQGKDLAIGYFSQTNDVMVQGVLLQDQYAFSAGTGFANTINTLIVSGSQVGNMSSTFRLTAYGTDPQAVVGSSWNDMLFGYGGGLTMQGGEGNDVLIASRLDDSTLPPGQIPGDWLLGQLGNDQLSGLNGNDTLLGGMGDDTLDGGPGNDVLAGGPGQDWTQFPGRFSDYTYSFEPSTRTLWVQDKRSTSLDSFGGLDAIKSIEEFVFQGDPAGAVTKNLVEMVSAAGQNHGVDLNGNADIALTAESWTGPNFAWQNTNDPAGYTRSSVTNIWAAEIGLKGGISALRLSFKDLGSLQGVSLQALLGWVGNGPNQGQIQVPVGVYSQPQQFQDNGVTLTATTLSHLEDGQAWYDLVVSAPNVLSNETMTQVLRNIRLSYASGSQPERDDATLDLKVTISADGQTWVGAQGGQSGTFRAHFDNSAPLAAVAQYKGSLLSIGFKDINGLPANLPGAQNAWAGLPDQEAFDVRIDGRSVVVRAVQHDSDGVLLMLGQDLPASGAVITVAYADPAGDTVRNVLQDWQGNDVPSFQLTAVPAPVFDATGTIGSGATLGFGLPEDGRSERDMYITEGAYMGKESVGRVISASAQTAVGEIIGTAWGINPSYRVGAAAGSVESFLWSREKGVATIAQPAGAPLAVGDSLSLVEMVNFNSPYLILGFDQYVLLSHDASTPPAAAESVLLSQASQSVGLPMWTVGAGHLLGGKILTLSGGPGNDQLSGLGEQVTLSGAAGDDTYTVTIYGTGTRTTISDSAGVADVLDLQAAAGFFFIPEFERVGNDLVSRVIDEPSRASTDTLTVRNAYASDGMPGEGRIETFRFSPDGDPARSWRFSHSNEGIWTSDLIAGTSGNESLRGFDGDDFIFDAGGDDLVEGGSGNDSIWIGAGNNTLRGGEGSDDYFWNPTVAGSNLLSDSTRGAQGDSLLMALPTFRLDANYSGQDLLLSSSRSGQVFSSLTLIDFRTTSSVRAFKPNIADHGSPSFVFSATVTSGNDWMVGEASADTLSGGDGDDLLMGSGGADLLEGGQGHDQLFGGLGADTLVGGAGDDIYVVNDAGDVVIELASDNTATQEIFSIGHNNDAVVATVSYTLSAGAAVEDMIASGVGLNGDLSDEAINLTGNELAQGMTGNEAANYLRGMGGDDAMVGMGGNDTLDGGDGNDYFLSGLGNDSIIGGPGDDGVLAFGGQAAGSNIFGIPGLVTVTGGFDTAVGGEGTDTIVVGGLEQDFEVVRSSQTQYLIRSKLDTTETLSFSGFEKVSFGLINFGGDPIQVNPKLVDLASYPVSSDPLSRVSSWKNANISVNHTHLDAAVGLIDAISILKMIVGLKINAGDSPLSPYQAIAADFNRSGSVDLNDAIEVLKHVVGLPSVDPAWSFYDDSQIPQTISGSQGLAPGDWSAAAKLSDLSAVPAEVKVIGVLTGDVDGSWAPA